MDHFGMGAAMRGMLQVYVSSARQTGRTASLLDSLKAGDRVVCITEVEASRIRGLCRERELDVKVVAMPPSRARDLFNQGSSQGRTVFEHTWVEEMYLRGLETIEREIDHLQRELSGYGEAHRETAKAYREMNKWRVGSLPPLPKP